MPKLLYLLWAIPALLFQTVLLPPFFPGEVKPDLLLLLTVWIGLREPLLRGSLIVYALGWVYDAYAGVYPGLHGLVLLAAFLTVRGVSTRLDPESLPLLWYLIGGVTLLQGALTVFALEFFTPAQEFWKVMALLLPVQVLYNLLAGYLLQSAWRRFRRPPPLAPLTRRLAG